jgi:hypothetical protein
MLNGSQRLAMGFVSGRKSLAYPQPTDFPHGRVEMTSRETASHPQPTEISNFNS